MTLPFQQTLSIVIPAYNEADSLAAVLESCQQLHPLEIIVVANGCTDHTADIAKNFGCQVIQEPQPIGNDIGRAMGAMRASGEVILFIDADFPISAKELRHFLLPIYKGYADVVLNDLDWIYHQAKRPHSTTVWRQVTNHLFGRKDLNIDSLLSVPHALTRKVIRQIGFQALGNPILAQLKIIQQGWRIAHQQKIDVITPNRYKPGEHGSVGPVLSRSERRIIGDHLAAVASYLRHPRGQYTDGVRRRDLLEQIKQGQHNHPQPIERVNQSSSSLYHGKKLSVIIPVQNEEHTIGQVLAQVRKIEPFEIIVVVNGSSDKTYVLAKQHGAKIVWFREALGNDVGRAIGAYHARGDILLFIDGDFVLSPRELFPFAKAIAAGADVAFNDLNHYLTMKLPLNIVTAYKYAVNTAADRLDLGVSSLVAVPHALSRRALEQIGWMSLASPVVAQMRAMLQPLELVAPKRINVDEINRIRPSEHYAHHGLPPAVERIIGDHLEGLHELIQQKGPRGLFSDDGRKWSKLSEPVAKDL